MTQPSDATQDLEARITRLEHRVVTDGAVDADALQAPPPQRSEPPWLDGARVVVRAWRDAEFRARLLIDPKAALAELGMQVSDGHNGDPAFQVVANTEAIHNEIVCTLCSCYPRGLLGPPPDWYRSEEYRARVVKEPRAVLREFGLEVPAAKTVQVWDSTADLRYMVLPQPPEDLGSFEDQALLELISPEVLVGTREPVIRT